MDIMDKFNGIIILIIYIVPANYGLSSYQGVGADDHTSIKKYELIN